MKLRYIPAFITLLAGIITCMISIIRQNEILSSLKTLLLVLIIFYIIGLIARNILNFAMQSNNNESFSDNKEELSSVAEDDNSLEGNSESGEELEP
ncbi:hypothetical protein EDD66_102447 [Mobilisporobacter senegalensis]|uniref:Uncharacterized protein n=1 Tax=Mobilisporobacter senegalensis TaxID=1329262 RepID=A0A3N1XZV3_9FIRM|nr:hypothetical protein [Mobilisporobacter senegalensis]ROR30792.1 hypothetical protein EDD66_102447 [Mobilisporobacter senegalensis]